MSEELKPCPFCGGEAYLNDGSDINGNYYFVGCSGCDIRTGSWYNNENNTELIKIWNTRHEENNEKSI